MATYTPNYNLEKPEASDPFGDFRQSYNDNMDKIDANLGGGGGSGGHTIYDADGNALAQESGLQFTGSVNVTDDAVNGRTVVDVSGGSNLILDAQIFSTEEKQIGVWIDRKPLYQKTFVLGSPLNISESSWTPTGQSVPNGENIIICLGTATDGTMTPLMAYFNNGSIECQTPRNGTSWNIQNITIQYTKTTDVAGSGGFQAYGFSPIIYSDVERVIGVWRDNKPLYQKTYHFNSLVTLNSNTWVDTGFRISNSVIVGNSVAFRDDNVAGQSFPVIASADVGTDQAIELLQTRNSSITISGFTIQYTKTTDVAGSGDYNTYGVPTVHYDTNEQVVGTYLGKPLYEKTWDFPTITVSSVGAWISTSINASDMALLVDVKTRDNNVVWSGISAVIDGGIIKLINTTSQANLGVSKITLQYTKVTD